MDRALDWDSGDDAIHDFSTDLLSALGQVISPLFPQPPSFVLLIYFDGKLSWLGPLLTIYLPSATGPHLSWAFKALP